MVGKWVKKKKMIVRKGILNFVFNEVVLFDILVDVMNFVDLLLFVMYENEVIGCVLFGVYVIGKEFGYWWEVCIVNKFVVYWYVL